jgi:hypothetical protein
MSSGSRFPQTFHNPVPLSFQPMSDKCRPPVCCTPIGAALSGFRVSHPAIIPHSSPTLILTHVGQPSPHICCTPSGAALSVPKRRSAPSAMRMCGGPRRPCLFHFDPGCRPFTTLTVAGSFHHVCCTPFGAAMSVPRILRSSAALACASIHVGQPCSTSNLADQTTGLTARHAPDASRASSAAEPAPSPPPQSAIVSPLIVCRHSSDPSSNALLESAPPPLPFSLSLLESPLPHRCVLALNLHSLAVTLPPPPQSFPSFECSYRPSLSTPPSFILLL